MFEAYTHNGDDKLLESLGLPTQATESKDGRSYLGTVVVEEAREPTDNAEARPEATVAVSVACYPAQFWRFEVARPKSVEPEGEGKWTYEVERLVIRTGSGSFGEYWPVAKQVAQGMVTVEAPPCG